MNPEATTDPTPGLIRAARIFEWMERYLWIRLKDNDTKALSLFRMNTVQQILALYVAECWHKGIPVKIMVPKARQMGISTFWTALGYALAEHIPGYHVGLVAHIEESVTEIFAKVRTFVRQMDPEWKPQLEVDQGARIEWAHESAYRTGTIKTGDALFKGPTLQMLHWSEAANFNDRGNDAEGTVASAKAALAETNLTIEVFESTAKGKDSFYWARCELARDPSSGYEHNLVFLPWFLQREYSMDWERYRQVFLERGKKDPGKEFILTAEERNLRESLAAVRVEPHQRFWKYRVDLTDAQLIWRRWAIQNVCGGKLDLFKRYYPATYEEAFTASASCMFDAKTIQHYRRHAFLPEHRGEVINAASTAAFDQRPRGHVQVWEMPVPGREYVIGADVGGEKKKSDPSHAYVVDKERLAVVAALNGHFEWDEYADKLYDLGQFYNWAEVVCENNHQPAIAKRLHRRDYPNLYYYVDDVTGKGNKTPGFNTNLKTRPDMVGRVDRACRLQIVLNPDPKFPEEMESFVWVPKANNADEGVYKATGSHHDDRIMALALALVQCPLKDATFKWERPPEKKKSYAQLYYEELLRKARAGDSGETPIINLARPRKVEHAS